MFKTIEYKNLEGNFILIDVRSPGEFNEATIPGAINIPIFDDEDRKIIGTVFVNESVEKAKKLGVEAVSKNLPGIYSKISELDKSYDKLVFFCAKGGMRSSSISSLMNSLGINAFRIKGGYKGYREFINEELPKTNKNIKYIVIHGKTGIGKTELLNCLKSKGHNVLDLEDAANHRGSLLGNVGLGKGRSQKQFESLVYESLRSMKGSYVFVEGESKRIGNIIIPQYIFESMVNGIHFLGDAELDFRAKILTREYAKKENCKEEIIISLKSMSKYIGEKSIDRYTELVLNGEYEEVAKELMVKYYDPMYTNEFNKYKYELKFFIDNIEASSSYIENWLTQYLKHNVKE
jgi:tRNA 2-selenouridine synthase